MNKLNDKEEQQYLAFCECFVKYPLISQIFDDFDRLRYNQRIRANSRLRQKTDMPCMLLTGDSGCGKSALVEHYRKRSNTEDTAHSLMPVLVSRIPDVPDLDLTIVEMLVNLKHFSSRYRLRRSKDYALTDSLLRGLKVKKTELIIIEEFQELIEFKTSREQQAISNRFKYISEESGIPLVLVGMPWTSEIAKVDPQWRSRLLYQRDLPYYKISDKNEFRHFNRLVNGLFKRMAIEIGLNAFNKHCYFALFSYSNGEMRALKNLLNEAFLQALIEKSAVFKKRHLRKAFDSIDPKSINPFLQTQEKIKISEVVTPSKFNNLAANAEDSIIPTKFTDKLPLSYLLKKNK